MRGTTARVLMTGLLLALVCIPAALGDGALLVKAGRIITMAGAPIEGGAILVEDGKIKRIGTDIKPPEGATVIEVPNGVVMPGLVDANARFGLRGDANEQSDEITPQFSIAQAFDRDSPEVERAAQLGTTTLRIVPGNSNVMAGAGVVVKTAGETFAERFVGAGDGINIVMGNDAAGGNRSPRSGTPSSFYYRQPTTRMGVVWALRQNLFNTQAALDAKEELTEAQAVIASALQGKTSVHVALRDSVDIETTFQIADEFGLKDLVLLQCTEGHKMAAEIAKRNVPVVLGPYYYYARTWSEHSEGGALSPNNAGILAAAGVTVALASNDPGGPANLLTVAAMAVRNGLDPEDALKAVTINPARIVGVADRVGSIEKGKDADLLILSGDPLSVTTRIEKVIINGRIAFDVESGANADG